VNQILYAESGSEISEEECKALCETYDASAYNWMDDTHPNGNIGCRCYASDALTFYPTGESWNFCTKDYDYICVEGFSPNWSTENQNARGSGVNQIVYAESGREISEEDCKALCETYNANAYNWMDDTHPNGNIACRCYASDALTFTPTGTDWQFCRQRSVCLLKEGSDCVTLLASATCYHGLASLGIDMQGTIASSGRCPCSCAGNNPDIDLTSDSNKDGIIDIACDSKDDCTEILTTDYNGDWVADFGFLASSINSRSESCSSECWKCSKNLCIPKDTSLDGMDCAVNEQCIEEGITCLPLAEQSGDRRSLLSGDRRDLSEFLEAFFECGEPRSTNGFCLDSSDCNSNNDCILGVCSTIGDDLDDIWDDTKDLAEDVWDETKDVAEDTWDEVSSWFKWSTSNHEAEEEVAAGSMAQSVSQISSTNSSTILHIFSFIGLLSSLYFLYDKCFKGKKYEIIHEPEV